jgi:hypothetical protein
MTTQPYKGRKLTLITYGATTQIRPAQPCLTTVDCRDIKPFKWGQVQADSPGFPKTLALAVEKISSLLPDHQEVGVGVYCAFGQHRSVAMAETLATLYSALGAEVTVKHLCKVETGGNRDCIIRG